MSRTQRKPRPHKPAPHKFAIWHDDGGWSPCDRTLNRLLGKALHDFIGSPDSITMRDEHGDPHTLSFAASHVLSLALLAMDARLRPGECYRERADEFYAVLAGAFHRDGVQELRRVFRLGANRPWLVP